MKAVIPKLWPGETFVCLGTGPSLTQADVDVVRGRARVIAVNDAYRLAPWSDVLYACDEKWWKWQARQRATEIASFQGLKFAMPVGGRNSKQAFDWVDGVQLLRATGEHGLEHYPIGLRHGRNSGHQAINLAVHLGAARIILLGYDMRISQAHKTHFFGQHPDHSKPLFRESLRNFQTLVKPLASLGIDIVNCSRQTALTCFQRAALEDAVRSEVAA